MSNPVCPNCQSGSVIPDASNGGAGRNYCQGCGHRAPVRDFHQPKAITTPRQGRRWTEVEKSQAAPKTRKPVDRQMDVVHKGHNEEFWWMKD